MKIKMLLMAIVFSISSLLVMPVFSDQNHQPKEPRIETAEEEEIYAQRRRRYRAPSRRRYRAPRRHRSRRHYRAPKRHHRSHGQRHGGCFIGTAAESFMDNK